LGVKECVECGAGFEARGNTKRCPPCRRRNRSVLAAVEAQLASIGKESGPLGAAALVLAARLDLGADPGSAMAAMSKELRTIMTELNRNASAVKDPVDELLARRKARRGA
jgi:hypothetical protein